MKNSIGKSEVVSLHTISDCRQSVMGADGILLDWDGCTALGGSLRPCALEFIRANRDRLAIVSNNSTHLTEDFQEILGRHGVELRPDRVVLAGVETLHRATAFAPAPTLVLSDARIKAYAKLIGINLVNEEPEIVVLLRDTRFSYARLQRAANAIQNGAKLIVANGDATHPGRNGMLIPETGALLAALTTCFGRDTPPPEIIGKPAPYLFTKACEALGVTPDRAVMIGDNPDTDLAGARALGMGACLVGPNSRLTFGDLMETC